MSHRIYCPDVESNTFSRTGLPDSPELEMQIAAEMDAAFGYDVPPTDEDVDAMYEEWRERQGFAAGGQGDDEPRPTSPTGAMFPEVVTWPDDHLTVAIDLCEQRDPGLNLHAVGNVPDRHEAFLHAVTAELVRRLEARGVRFAA